MEKMDWKLPLVSILRKENEELALSTDLYETVASLNDFSKLQQLGNTPHITLLVSNERPLPPIL